MLVNSALKILKGKAALTQIPAKVSSRCLVGRGPAVSDPLGLRCRIKRLHGWLEDSWFGDLLALLCLSGISYVFLLIGWVLG